MNTMQDEQMDPMTDALKRRRGKGLDISILINGDEVNMDDKKTDLAPKGEMPPEGEPAPEEMPPEGEDAEMMEAMGGPMDEEQMAGMTAGKPRSLGERAKFEAMKKMKK